MGELLMRQKDSNAVEAQRCFERAIEVAQKQSAKSLELRATMSLSRLLASQDRLDEARRILAGIYNWFYRGLRHRRPERCESATGGVEQLRCANNRQGVGTNRSGTGDFTSNGL
jgi:hypothetical protein